MIFRFGDIKITIDGIIIPSRALAKMASEEDEVMIDETETNSDVFVSKEQFMELFWFRNGWKWPSSLCRFTKVSPVPKPHNSHCKGFEYVKFIQPFKN